MLSCISSEAPRGRARFCLKKSTKINAEKSWQKVTALLPSPSPAPKRIADPIFPEDFWQVSIFLAAVDKIPAGWEMSVLRVASGPGTQPLGLVFGDGAGGTPLSPGRGPFAASWCWTRG